MKTVSDYQMAKQTLKNVSNQAKENYPTDKPAIRQTINNYMDYLCKNYKLSDYQRNLLSNYACKLHPKN
jgi:predicted GNAT superfamily acetyltransferase